MCEDHYLPNEYNYIQYEASSGGLSCPDSDARQAYYGMSGIPDLRIDGNWYIQVGAGSGDIDGQNYINVIDSHRAVSAPMAVVVSDYSFDPANAFAEVKVKLFADYNPANHFIRVAIVEDNLVYGSSTYQNVLRDMLTDTALTISANGEEQVVTLPIPMSGAWVPSELQIIAFVQNDSDKYVIQSGNSFVGEYGGAVGVDGAQQVVADGGTVTFGNTNIINIALNNDVFDVSLDTTDLPAGWSANLLYDGNASQAFSMPLDSFASGFFNVQMATGTVGSGRVTVTITSQGSGNVVETLDFAALAGGTDLLVIADDNGAGHAYDAYAPAIDPTGKTYAVWDNGLATVTAGDLTGYEAVIWESGSFNQSLQTEDRAALDGYLAAGGKLLLAGEDLLESCYTQGGAARLWYQLKLRINYGSGNSGQLGVTGQPGTIGDGLAFTLGGGDPDQIVLLNGQPVEEAFRFGNGLPAGTQTTYGAYQAILLPFGLERVPTAADRAAIINGALDWFGLLNPLAADDVPAAGADLRQNVPNPFNPMTKISFVLDRAGAARLEIFNARGHLVRVLTDESLEAGTHEFLWDGTTASGDHAASGTYFYRLSAGDEQVTRKMSLVK